MTGDSEMRDLSVLFPAVDEGKHDNKAVLSLLVVSPEWFYFLFPPDRERKIREIR